MRPLGQAHLSAIQWFALENTLLRDKQDEAARAGQNCLAEQIVLLAPCPVEAVSLARQWQAKLLYPWMILLAPALAVANGATHFVSVDPRTRTLASQAGLALFPSQL